MAHLRLTGSYADRKKELSGVSREFLEQCALDAAYNEFLSSRDEYGKDEDDKHGHGKRIPYIGWFWRNVDFHDLSSIPIGDCGEFVGFMENNKWDYPQRRLTQEEGEKIVEIIDEAISLSFKGGVLSEIDLAVNTKLDELWDYMQTLKVPRR